MPHTDQIHGSENELKNKTKIIIIQRKIIIAQTTQLNTSNYYIIVRNKLNCITHLTVQNEKWRPIAMHPINFLYKLYTYCTLSAAEKHYIFWFSEKKNYNFVNEMNFIRNIYNHILKNPFISYTFSRLYLTLSLSFSFSLSISFSICPLLWQLFGFSCLLHAIDFIITCYEALYDRNAFIVSRLFANFWLIHISNVYHNYDALPIGCGNAKLYVV